ncbi:MAG: hypothetical protein IT426_00805 [Pirellulales bacterium]|nr:hypothetical protein [Pirellulales bacterium]
MISLYRFFPSIACGIASVCVLLSAAHCTAKNDESPAGAMDRWLKPQQWNRCSDKPPITLGEPGKFDDMHVFAPAAIFENGEYWLYYCGSQGGADVRKIYKGNLPAAAKTEPPKAGGAAKKPAAMPVNKDGYPAMVQRERLYKIGLAKSKDGVHFTRANDGDAVFEFGDGIHSAITPAILRNTDGTPVRENGKMRMWFTAVDFPGDYLHNIFETTSADGIRWTPPTGPVLKNVYAPCVLKDGEKYWMWYCNPARHPWHIGAAQSDDGTHWKMHDKPCIQIDQAWECKDIVYSSVVKVDGVFVMLYGGYWKDQFYTALGMAVSKDGLNWTKNPHNPVFKPEPSHDWESNYTTSQSIMRRPDGTWRLWYASRSAPPFINLYVALGAATWAGPDK